MHRPQKTHKLRGLFIYRLEGAAHPAALFIKKFLCTLLAVLDIWHDAILFLTVNMSFLYLITSVLHIHSCLVPRVGIILRTFKGFWKTSTYLLSKYIYYLKILFLKKLLLLLYHRVPKGILTPEIFTLRDTMIFRLKWVFRIIPIMLNFL